MDGKLSRIILELNILPSFYLTLNRKTQMITYSKGNVALIPDEALAYPVHNFTYGVDLLKLLKPFEEFATFGFSGKAFIHFPLCYHQFGQS